MTPGPIMIQLRPLFTMSTATDGASTAQDATTEAETDADTNPGPPVTWTTESHRGDNQDLPPSKRYDQTPDHPMYPILSDFVNASQL